MDENYRTWPIPGGRAVMPQRWSELLFAHWPVAPEVLQPLMPAGLKLDTFDGMAWVGVVPFLMSQVRPYWIPSLPYISHFAELNVRTYVTLDNKPGVYFFSLDANNRLAVAAARVWYHLPYFRARMSVQKVGDEIKYSSERTHPGYPTGTFSGTYRPTGAVFHSQPDTLEHFLTARYCLYSVHQGKIYRGEINHVPWPLQPAEADLKINTVAQSHGIELPDTAPHLLFSRSIDVLAWSIRQVK